MISGLRVLPYLQDARREDRNELMCGPCLETNDEHVRRDMGCGLLEREPEFKPRHVPFTEHVADLEDCAGYVADLPDVADVARAFVHWTKGELDHRMGGLEPSPALLDGIEILASSVDAWQAHKMKPKEGA